jgi:hypothetical protein
MWPWRRKPASAPEAAARLPVSRAEWRTLPPIQRVLPDHPLVNPVQRFTDSLTSWQNPSYLRPLGHNVGPAEPSGTADLAVGVSAVDMPLAIPPRRLRPVATPVESTLTVARSVDVPVLRLEAGVGRGGSG